MVISAAHFKDVTNGYEKRTDGLWTHTGRFVVKGGPVDLPAGSVGADELATNAATIVWAAVGDGGSYPSNPSAWTWYTLPGIGTITFTVPVTALVRFDWSVDYNSSAPDIVLFCSDINGADNGERPSPPGPIGRGCGIGFHWRNCPAGTYTSKLRYMVTAGSSTFTRNPWWTFFLITAYLKSG